ncbi:MAG: tryptophan synthase subunit alpha [Candidatus Margulisbacteria bacterium]|nr:tryptophan synthase subunit alpha [Candidatus Margulisiibacteriota bacterium]
MGSIGDIFKARKALIAFITAGDPSLSVTEKLVYDLEKAGADIIELGIPFSDPLADGPIIQASHQRALKKNTSLADVFKLVAKVRKKAAIPICFMLSYNLIVQYGEDKFYADCDKFGVDGVIIPDLPPEEGARDKGQAARISFVAPTSSEERIKLAAEKSSGFIYLVSVAGITGVRKKMEGSIGGLVDRVRKYTKLPIAVGFGISTPAQAKEVAKQADGVIVGSAIVDLVARKKFKAVVNLVAALRRGVDAV